MPECALQDCHVLAKRKHVHLLVNFCFLVVSYRTYVHSWEYDALSTQHLLTLPVHSSYFLSLIKNHCFMAYYKEMVLTLAALSTFLSGSLDWRIPDYTSVIFIYCIIYDIASNAPKYLYVSSTVLISLELDRVIVSLLQSFPPLLSNCTF